jgi:hypothetical protein
VVLAEMNLKEELLEKLMKLNPTPAAEIVAKGLSPLDHVRYG